MKTILLFLFLSLSFSTLSQEVKTLDPEKILKEKGSQIELNSKFFKVSVNSVFDKDFRGRRARKKGIQKFKNDCLKIRSIVNQDLLKLVGAKKVNKHVDSFISTTDFGKLGTQYVCYLTVHAHEYLYKDLEVNFSYHSTPIFTGKTGNEQSLKDCSELKYALRENRVETQRIAIHERYKNFRTRRGATNKKSYACQIMWAKVSVTKKQEEPSQYCKAGEILTKSFKPKNYDLAQVSQENFYPYNLNKVPAKPLGYYDDIAYNQYRNSDGSIFFEARKIVEEKQIPFFFQLNSLAKLTPFYKINNIRLKTSFVKSLKNLGNNPTLNLTEILCLRSQTHLCSGEVFNEEWKKYLNPYFWNQANLVNSLISDVIRDAKRMRKSPLSRKFIEVFMNQGLENIFSEDSIDTISTQVLKDQRLEFVMTDDVWVEPDQTELLVDLECR